MSTRSPVLSESIAMAPSTWVARSPLNRDIRIEKLVMGMSSGVSAATLRKAWESVTTRRGGRVRRSKAARSSRSLTTMHMASPSSRSRMAWTCGMMSRPRGASLSMGTTRIASSPGPTKSLTSAVLSRKSAGAAAIIASRSSPMPWPVAAETITAGVFASRRPARAASAGR